MWGSGASDGVNDDYMFTQVDVEEGLVTTFIFGPEHSDVFESQEPYLMQACDIARSEMGEDNVIVKNSFVIATPRGDHEAWIAVVTVLAPW